VILSDLQIRRAQLHGDIKIEPFDEKALGTNSYDVHLGETLMTYREGPWWERFGRWLFRRPRVLDCRTPNDVVEHVIGPEGFVLKPGRLYLGVTKEYTETHKHVPFLDGKSSIGRLGIFIHCTAGRGDVGFCNHWTLEIVVVQPVRVYANMPIGQLIYFETSDVAVRYDQKANAKYRERCTKPVPSYMYRNFEPRSDA
jgi:dCTP deaminase